MDDIQIIICIAFVIFAIVSRALKGNNQKKSQPARPKPSNSGNQNKPQTEGRPKQVSFEELLREFTQEKSSSPPKVEEVEEYNSSYNIDDEIQRVYEESVRSSQRSEKELEKGDERHTGNFRHFNHYSEEDLEDEEHELASMLRDTESAKRAIILGEIINRKY